MIPSKHTQALVALAVGAAVALTACGSSSSASKALASGSGSSSQSAITAKIMVAVDVTSAIPFTAPEEVPTVKAVLRDFPGVQIEVCDTKGTAAAGLVCEHQAVQDHVAAVIAGFGSIFENETLLTQAGIPTIGLTDETSSNSFPIVGPTAELVAEGVGLSELGCTKLGNLYYAGASSAADAIKQGMVGSGGTEVSRAEVAANAPDVAPAVAKLTDAGATCIAVELPPNNAAQALTAVKQSGKAIIVSGHSAVFSSQVINSLGALANGIYVIDMQLNLADPAPAIAQIAAAEKSEQASAPLTDQSITAWVSARLVAAALPKVQGAVTSSSMMTALMSLRNVDMNGVIPPWSSIPLNNSAHGRLFNHYGINYKVIHGKPVRQGTFYDIGPLLNKS